MPQVSLDIIYLGESKVVDNNGTPYIKLDKKILKDFRGLIKVYYDFKKRQFVMPFTMEKCPEGSEVIDMPPNIRQDHYIEFLAIVRSFGTKILRKDVLFQKYRLVVKGKDQILKAEMDVMLQYLITTKKIFFDHDDFMHYIDAKVSESEVDAEIAELSNIKE